MSSIGVKREYRGGDTKYYKIDTGEKGRVIKSGKIQAGYQ